MPRGDRAAEVYAQHPCWLRLQSKPHVRCKLRACTLRQRPPLSIMEMERACTFGTQACGRCRPPAAARPCRRTGLPGHREPPSGGRAAAAGASPAAPLARSAASAARAALAHGSRSALQKESARPALQRHPPRCLPRYRRGPQVSGSFRFLAGLLMAAMDRCLKSLHPANHTVCALLFAAAS